MNGSIVKLTVLEKKKKHTGFFFVYPVLCDKNLKRKKKKSGFQSLEKINKTLPLRRRIRKEKNGFYITMFSYFHFLINLKTIMKVWSKSTFLSAKINPK